MTVTQLITFKEILRTRSLRTTTNKQTRDLLLYLFTGTRGGFMRLKIIMRLVDQPFNTHQLSQELGVDYKTVQHHLKVLEKNNLVLQIGKKYGALFHLSDFLEMNIGSLVEVIDKLEQKMNKRKIYL